MTLKHALSVRTLFLVITARFKKKPRCHFCNKPGHFKRDCEEFAKVKGQSKPDQDKKTKMGVFKVTITAEDENCSDGENTGLVVQHAFSADSNAHDQFSILPCDRFIVRTMFPRPTPWRFRPSPSVTFNGLC